MRLVALEAEDLEESSAVVVDGGAVVGGLQETTAEIEVEIGTSISVTVTMMIEAVNATGIASAIGNGVSQEISDHDGHLSAVQGHQQEISETAMALWE
jgi:hypothetical protein